MRLNQEESRLKKNERAKEYRTENRLIILEKKKDYYLKNKVKILEYGRSPQKRAYLKKYWSTPKGRYKRLKIGSKQRKLLVSLTFNEWFPIASQPCHYCGRENLTMGIDRIDNSSGYYLGNIIPCCYRCNIARGAMTQKEFIEMCHSIVRRHELTPVST